MSGQGAYEQHLSRVRDLLVEAVGQVNAAMALEGLSREDIGRLQRAVWNIDAAYGEVDKADG